MATQADIEAALSLMHEKRPYRSIGEIQKVEMGLFAALHFLHDAKGDVHAKDIARALHISSARTAILLKKLCAKNWINKAPAANDARAVAISLSAEGAAVAAQLRAGLQNAMGKVVDELGIDQLRMLFEQLGRVRDIMYENTADLSKLFDKPQA